MVHNMQSLDPHQRPPDGIRAVYKKYQKIKTAELDTDSDIIDLKPDSHTALPGKVHVVKELRTDQLKEAFRAFIGGHLCADAQHESSPSTIAVYEHDDMPGLHFIPSLLPLDVQSTLLSRLLHRDLSNPNHLTNIHTHYTLSYPPPSPFSQPATSSNLSPTSFFTHPPSSPSPIAHPLNPQIHKPLIPSQILTKKLRWLTLGGQYDWTAKKYPESTPPSFPSDIKDLLETIFPETKAQAAIMNLYSPGDTLSVHRDVAESSAHGLVSVSLGCEGVFVIGTNHCSSNDDEEEDEAGGDGGGDGGEEKIVTMRLRSGSAVYMSGAARFAWHGVPQIVGGTCPEELGEWPAVDGQCGEYEEWRGWMRGKRVNLNVRQMWD